MKALIDVITDFLSDDFEKDLFKATIQNLNDRQNVLRFNNFAYSLRELSRHFLKRLAPDAEILQCQWFKNETDKPNGITRAQRAIYCVKGGLSDDFVQTTLNVNLLNSKKDLIDAINNLSKFTHIEEDHIAIADATKDADAIKSLQAIKNFFITTTRVRDRIVRSLEEKIADQVNEASISDTIGELDIIATHYFIDETFIHGITVKNIDHEFINVVINGSIDVELQYGSNSDLKNDIGATFNDSFPFECNLKIPVDNPLDVDISTDDISVDNSSFFGE